MSRAARLGVFIVTTLAILATGIFLIGNKQCLFTSTYQLKVQFNNVAGLETGGDVRLGGVHSGTVRDIELPHKPGDEITVVMDMRSSTREVIKRDSVASIETEGLLGNQYVAISFGSAGTADVRNGDTISSQPPLEMSDLLKKTNGILDSSQEAIENATQATANLNSISAKIDGGKGTVGALVNDKTLYTALGQTMSTMRDATAEAQAGATDFQEDMEALKHNFFVRGYFNNRGYEDSTELAKDEIERLPQSATLKEFTYQAKQLFDKQDSAKLRNEKSLNGGGEFLADNGFGFAVVVASTGMEGDTQEDLVLTEARAMVVREYLVENFGFDDSHLKTLGMGKRIDAKGDASWGTVQIPIYPDGVEMPPGKNAVARSLSQTAPSQATPDQTIQEPAPHPTKP